MAVAMSFALALGLAPLLQPTALEGAAKEFLDAFKKVDLARFDQFFAADVTMFFPDGPFLGARKGER